MSFEVKNLNIFFQINDGQTHAVRNLSLSIPKGKAIGIVGESGSGKSITGLSLMGLQPTNAIVEFERIDLEGKSHKEICRGTDIGMVFQDPMSNLDPCFTVENHFNELFESYNLGASRDKREFAISWLKKVGIPDPEKRIKNYPHQLSGGMAQRVMIALALCLKPKLLIADEPTTALDVTIQNQILGLLNSIQHELNMSMILISHDLGVISNNTDYIYVMYLGEVVEEGITSEVLLSPKHPYTKKLLESLPSTAISMGLKSLPTIPGVVPSLKDRPLGCQLAPRCYKANEICNSQSPVLRYIGNEKVKCHFPEENI